MFSVVICALFIITSSSSQCIWTVTNPDNGQQVSLDLTPLEKVTINATDTQSPPHNYIFTPCQNNVTCKENSVMTIIQTNYNDCYILGRFDQSKTPQYQSINDGTWTFTYDNGDDDCGNPARTWAPTFVCNPNVKYKAGPVQEIPYCFYEIEIQTEFACPNWTTTTTSIPTSECVFRSAGGNHILNMTAIKGKLLSEAVINTGHLYYMYTPCVNAAKCGENTLAMAYIFDGMNFDCKQYLAIWEDGFVEPNYIEGVGMWQFTYTNGQPCDGGQTVFNVEWFCDKSATSPKIIQAAQIATCVYQMVINSSLACG